MVLSLACAASMSWPRHVSRLCCVSKMVTDVHNYWRSDQQDQQDQQDEQRSEISKRSQMRYTISSEREERGGGGVGKNEIS